MDRIEIASPLVESATDLIASSQSADLSGVTSYCTEPATMATRKGWGSSYSMVIRGVNQQTGEAFEDTQSGNTLSGNTSFGSGWTDGYYRIFVRAYKSNSREFVECSNRPLYWNRSPIRWMTYIQPGTFIMGSPTTELGRSSDETLHRVTLTSGFYIARIPMTHWLWNLIMGVSSTGSNIIKGGIRYSMFNADGRIMWYTTTWEYGYVSSPGANWSATTPTIYDSAGRLTSSSATNDADSTASGGTSLITTIRANSSLATTGYVWELPTEAQWEYACRAGTKTAFANGVNLSTTNDVAQPQINEICAYLRSNSMLVSATLLRPNAWGLYAMHGNVWEWCRDWYGTYPTGAVSDPTGSTTGSYRVLRGGSSYHAALNCRSARRGIDHPGNGSSYYGCRVCLSQV
jgi:formylglycine-generating enzyme required for sulfatase activity